MTSKIRFGSSKVMEDSGTPGLLLQTDSGRSSVFDRGSILDHRSYPLAKWRTMQTACAFAWLERYDIRTHMVDVQKSLMPKHKLLVQEARVRDLPLLSGYASLTVIGLELLFRVKASAKFCERVAAGEVILPADVWPSDQTLQPGDRFLKPYVEASTKWEKLDRYLTAQEAARLVGIDAVVLAKLYGWVSDIAIGLAELYSRVGAELIDGKVEAARDDLTGEFVLIDGISLDELGVMQDDQHYGKNILRDWYKHNHPEWCAKLKRAQKAHPDDPAQWPPYPPLEAAVWEMYVQRYEDMARKLVFVTASRS